MGKEPRQTVVSGDADAFGERTMGARMPRLAHFRRPSSLYYGESFGENPPCLTRSVHKFSSLQGITKQFAIVHLILSFLSLFPLLHLLISFFLSSTQRFITIFRISHLCIFDTLSLLFIITHIFTFAMGGKSYGPLSLPLAIACACVPID